MQTLEQGWSPKENITPGKVLVIEDSDDHWALIQQIIRASLPQVDLVRITTSIQTLTVLTEWLYQEWELPKLILLDLCLPGPGEGLRILEQIKQMPAPVYLIPVVMLSASNVPADIAKAYELGVSAYLIKPTNFKKWPVYLHGLCAYWWEISEFPPLHYVI